MPRALAHSSRSPCNVAPTSCASRWTTPTRRPSIVNALQRHATVVVQKSLAEGFGLTVAEAMWKSRPVVGSAVGGIVDQIVSGETGVLLDDAHDLEHYADDRRLAPRRCRRTRPHGNQRLGTERYEQFLGDRHLEQWAQLFADLDRPR